MNYSKMTLAEIDAEIESIMGQDKNAQAFYKLSELYKAKAERWEEIALTAICAYENDDCDAGCPINPLECMITTQISSEFEQEILKESEDAN